MLTLNYTISPKLLSTIKRITLLVHELNKRQIAPDLRNNLQGEAYSKSLALLGGDDLALENYGHARDWVLRLLDDSSADFAGVDSADFLNTDTILRAHSAITKGFLPANQSGHWRTVPISINDASTGAVRYTPPLWQDVPRLMDPLLSYVHNNISSYDPVILAGLFHRQFAIIRPFTIGNRRTAQLLTTLLLAQLNLRVFPQCCFEHIYAQNVTRYHQQVGIAGDFYNDVKAVDHTNWLEFFSNGVLAELQRIEKQIERQSASPLLELKAHHQQILQLIDSKGYVTDSDYAKTIERAKATRTLDFNHLRKLGLIERVGKGRATFYRRLAA